MNTILILFSYFILSQSITPICTKIGTPREGWYWEDDGRLVALDNCNKATLTCKFEGTSEEGWYANDMLVVPGQCKRQPTHVMNVGDVCSTNDDCGVDYCGKETGKCSDEGNCTVLPSICTKELRPVCGCDGKNYSNACHAAMSGISVDYTGWCQDSLECDSNSDCPSSMDYCSKTDAFCVSQGACVSLPTLCTLHYDPVCGCDGQIYANPCHAQSNGTNVFYYGECNDTRKCIDNTECGAEEFCYKQANICSDGVGECMKMPEICTIGWNPVCACDGLTYNTACLAFAHAQSVMHVGSC